MKTYYYLEVRIKRGKRGQERNVRICATTKSLVQLNKDPQLISRIRERAGLSSKETITVIKIIEWRRLNLTPIALR
jgi:hypothetical protein